MTLYPSLQEYLVNKEVSFAKGRLMGLDIGQKTIGVSVSDTTHSIATPLNLIERKSIVKDTAVLEKIMVAQDVLFVVVGMPLNLDGSVGPQGEKTRQFIEKAGEIITIDMDFVFWDERFSTQAVERIMLHADLSRAKRDKNIDKAAAGFILQGALDFMKNFYRNQ